MNIFIIPNLEQHWNISKFLQGKETVDTSLYYLRGFGTIGSRSLADIDAKK